MTPTDHRDQATELLDHLGACVRAQDPNALLEEALAGLMAFVGAARGFVLMQEPTGRPRVRAARALDRETVRGDAFRRVRRIAEYVLGEGEPFVSASLAADSRFVGDESPAVVDTSVLVLPLRRGERVVGAVYVDRPADPDIAPLATLEMPLVQRFAALVGGLLGLHARMRQLRVAGDELRLANMTLERTMNSLQEDVAVKSVELAQAERDLDSTQRALGLKYTFNNIVGRSPEMQRIFDVLNQVMDYPVPMLITGESGTGKELIARALHHGGPRSKEPFMAINCAAIPENLLESELFGFKRGAFTGATAAKEGLFRAARRGTVFLDEIGEMPLSVQAKLLRVLQEKEVRPIGGRESEPVEARIVAATNRNLREEVHNNRFREDLYYRLNVVEVGVPPLRNRVEDIPTLADHFLERLSADVGLPRKRLSPAAVRRLMQAPWPGNVRQLENAIKSSAILSRGETISAEELRLPDPAGFRPSNAPPPAPPPLQSAERSVEASLDRDDPGASSPAGWTLGGSSPPSGAPPGSIRNRADWEAHEKQRILDALVQSGWNKTRAAEVLGVSRRNLYRKLARYGIEGAD
jgi:transcriptional regulator with GAF, ATPase, and Fis domain